jgi:hypothetical protein
LIRRASKTVKIHHVAPIYIKNYSDTSSYACGGATRHAISSPGLAILRLRSGHSLNFLVDEDDTFDEIDKSELRNSELSSVPSHDGGPLGILTAPRLDFLSVIIMARWVSSGRARKIIFASSTNNTSCSGLGYPSTPKPNLASLQSARASMKRISSSRVRTASTVMVEFAKVLRTEAGG